MEKYRKKPVVIEAIQFFYKNIPHPECVHTLWVDPNGKKHYDEPLDKNSIAGVDFNFVIRTLEGDMFVSNGDWIIKGINGEFYPCRPDIFEKTYELVKESL